MVTSEISRTCQKKMLWGWKFVRWTDSQGQTHQYLLSAKAETCKAALLPNHHKEDPQLSSGKYKCVQFHLNSSIHSFTHSFIILFVQQMYLPASVTFVGAEDTARNKTNSWWPFYSPLGIFLPVQKDCSRQKEQPMDKVSAEGTCFSYYPRAGAESAQARA
jgi:hypothetical protein